MALPSYCCESDQTGAWSDAHRRTSMRELRAARKHTMLMITYGFRSKFVTIGWDDFWRSGTVLTPDSVSRDRGGGTGAAAWLARRDCRIGRPGEPRCHGAGPGRRGTA